MTKPSVLSALTLTVLLTAGAAARAQQEQSAPPAAAPPAAPAAPASPTPEEAAEGKALLESAIKAHGGEAFLKMKSLRVTGKGELTAPENQGGFKLPLDTVTLLTAAPGRSRLDAESVFGRLSFGAPGGGKKAWYRLGEGSASDLPSAETPFADPTAVLRGAAGGDPVRSLRVDPGVVIPDAKALKAFEIRGAGGATSEVYVDADTSLIRRVRTKAGKNDIVTLLGGYKAVSGVQLPTALTVRQNGVDLLALTLTGVEVDVPVEEKVFEKPVSPTAAAPTTTDPAAAPPPGGA